MCVYVCVCVHVYNIYTWGIYIYIYIRSYFSNERSRKCDRIAKKISIKIRQASIFQDIKSHYKDISIKTE